MTQYSRSLVGLHFISEELNSFIFYLLVGGIVLCSILLRHSSVRDHLFSVYAKFSKKPLFLNP